MKMILKSIAVLLLPVAVALAATDKPAVTAEDLQKAVGQWVELRKDTAAAQADWQEQQAALKQEIELLQKESQQLGEEIARLRKINTEDVAAVAAARKRMQTLAGQVVELDRKADTAVADLKYLLSAVPPPLMSDNLKYLPVNCGGTNTVENLQKVLAGFAEVAKLEGNTHAVRAVLEIDGQRRAMDVVYLGLARGYAVAPDNSTAAIGAPGPDGEWKWQMQPEIAGAVRKLFCVKNGECVPEIVNLPVAGKFKEVKP